jgi:phosphatidylserine/phosphatidylglycerophosphate/cardiolipin synthase-like enzyme
MSIDLKVYDNGDHTCLVWLPENGKAIPHCRGFTIRRMVKGGSDTYLHGFVGFSDNEPLDANAPWKRPVQRFMWSDYGVAPGQVVQYSIVPVTGDRSNLQLDTANASPPSPPMTISSQASSSISAYFNKGIVSAQWVSRALSAVGPRTNIADLIIQPGNPLRDALSGLLRPRILDLLEETKKNNGQIYAALYELNDPELLQAIKSLGKRCHLILANGAFKPPANDENRAVRGQLRGVVDLSNRMVSQGHFAHNKFMVFCDSAGRPHSVLSGSTNWTMTGLCTQANNAILVNDAKLAQDFLDEWTLLKKAGNAYPKTLAATNSKARSFTIDGAKVTQWFAPTNKAPDLAYARKLINAAEQGILFLFFNPGAFVADDKPEEKWTLLQNILFRHHEGTENYNGNLYIHGVVNQEIKGLTAGIENRDEPSTHVALDPEQHTPIALYSGGKQPPQRLGFESMVPKNIKDTFHDWATEILGQGVHVHSKVVVLDPFGKNPVVMTGSHNLGFKASSKNDDNLMIIEGNAALAASYAANIIAIYQAYRWNAYVEAHRQDPKVWHGLVDNDTWQQGYLTGDDRAELEFWMGGRTVAAGQQQAPAQVPKHVPPAAPVHSARPKKQQGGAKKKAHPKKKAHLKRAAASQKIATRRSPKPKAKLKAKRP